MVASILCVILVFTLMFWCGHLIAKFAAQRGRSRGPWFLLGTLFYPVPYIVLALLPPRSREKAAISS